jgi:hypothetical protein
VTETDVLRGENAVVRREQIEKLRRLLAECDGREVELSGWANCASGPPGARSV